MTGRLNGLEWRSRDPWFRRSATPLLIVGVALFIATLENTTLWRLVFRITSLREDQWSIVALTFCVLFCPVVIGLTLAVGSRCLKVVAIAALLSSAVFGFVMSPSGYAPYPALVRDAFESASLNLRLFFSAAFAMHFLAFGIVPSLLVAVASIPSLGWKRVLVQRAWLGAICIAVLLGVKATNSPGLSHFAGQYRAARVLINPVYPAYSAARFLIASSTDTEPGGER